MADRGVRPNVVTCGTVISGLCRIREVDLALELHRNMVKWKRSPNLITYNSLIHGFRNVGRVSEAMRVFDEMLSREISADVVTYTCLIYAVSIWFFNGSERVF
ncbi:hypothetical protein C5167_004589 [Papaver somniferum]|uniref:Pentacotripeptide-repeat region of PRORP domain-containing protein n=1 Tax=Papaver somniferum TaxID=3469 RepID=A0A4Y7J825_PAPSO|nr:hypothetical protein C5167_004589 [Papaver somniferum]